MRRAAAAVRDVTLAASLGLLCSGMLLASPTAAGRSLPGLGEGQAAIGVQHAGQPYLGIDVRDVPDEEAARLHLHDTHGAEIVRVDHDGPAGKMGLREHDVIVAMNGVVIGDQEQIRHMLRILSPGNQVVLLIDRNGQMLNLTTAMADRGEVERQAWAQHLVAPSAQAPSTGLPSGDTQSFTAASSDPAPSTRYGKSFLGALHMSPSATGATLEVMGPQLAQFFGVPGGSGLLVRSVAESSPAAQAGLHAGDIVLRANDRGMTTLNDWAKQIRKSKGHPVEIIVLRGKDQKTLTLLTDGKHRSSLEKPGETVAALSWAWTRIASF